MSKYVWCEDSGSGLTFWREIFKLIDKEIIVESKGSNSELRKAISKIQNDGNEYYFLFDTVMDNPDVVRELKRINQITSEKNNIHRISIHSFEFTLLSFSLLEEWIFAENDDLKNDRKNIIEASKIFVSLMVGENNADKLVKIKELFEKEFDYKQTYTSEKIAAKFLFELTRNTGFETNKSRLGSCFFINCCELSDRQSDDICGLDNNRLTSNEKKKQIVEYSILKESLKEVGLYDNNI